MCKDGCECAIPCEVCKCEPCEDNRYVAAIMWGAFLLIVLLALIARGA
jgi:hypothetical protein